MFAKSRDPREIELSYYSKTTIGIRWLWGVIAEHSVLLRWITLLFSVALHVLVLWFGFSSITSISVETPRARLQYVNLASPVDEHVDPPRVVEPSIDPERIHKALLLSMPLPESVEYSSLLEPLTPQELKQITDAYPSQRDSENSAVIAKSVFHPGLRKQLTIEANKPKLARVEDDNGPKTYTDPSGATVVVLGNGSCLRSPGTTSSRGPRNWYMTPCGGKAESEQMLERVVQSLHDTLEFNK